MIVALAGRRIDAANAEVYRFPIQNIDVVTNRLTKFFSSNNITALVCSGACGADLLALAVAGELSVYRNMVLPYEPQIFRTRSVIDRPGNWGILFDSIYDEINKKSGIIILNYSEDDNAVYEKTNIEILKRARDLSEKDKSNMHAITALIVWDGNPREPNDITEHFMKEAKKSRYKIEEINTLK